MPRSRTPSPSRAAEKLREYLDIIASKQIERGKALRYDIYRRAGNEYQTDCVIKYLMENRLIKGNKKEGYQLTKKGQVWHEILKKHRDLVGVLTRELSGIRWKQL